MLPATALWGAAVPRLGALCPLQHKPPSSLPAALPPAVPLRPGTAATSASAQTSRAHSQRRGRPLHPFIIGKLHKLMTQTASRGSPMYICLLRPGAEYGALAKPPAHQRSVRQEENWLAKHGFNITQTRLLWGTRTALARAPSPPKRTHAIQSRESPCEITAQKYGTHLPAVQPAPPPCARGAAPLPELPAGSFCPQPSPPYRLPSAPLLLRGLILCRTRLLGHHPPPACPRCSLARRVL